MIEIIVNVICVITVSVCIAKFIEKIEWKIVERKIQKERERERAARFSEMERIYDEMFGNKK